MLRKTHVAKYTKGQGDHVDAWLMSYADLITLLFMLFVIIVSVSVAHQPTASSPVSQGEPEHPYHTERAGTLALGTAFDQAYRSLTGVVLSSHADQYIAIEKTPRGIAIDISAVQFFDSGSAEVPLQQLPVLKSIVHALKEHAQEGRMIEVEGHTGDMPLKNSRFTNNWELAAMRSAKVVSMLIEEGVDPSMLRATSFAGMRPLVPNQDAAGKAIADNEMRNQRIVIKLEREPANLRVAG